MFSHSINRCVCYFGLVLLSTINASVAYSAEHKTLENVEDTQSAPATTALPATNQPKSSSKSDATTLPEVKVSGNRIKEKRIDKTQSISKITSEDMDRQQVSNVFDAVRNTAGVSVDGGPRLNGMSFNIRGFESDDVAVSVDGVLKNYEKYRSKGTYIEPDLLKTIEIRRGPQITSNAGYIGGAVITTTKDAEDFLLPGQSVGARAKFGYGSNNDEYLRSYLTYARPHEKVDLVYNYTNRQSNNIMQGGGKELPYSNINTVSELYKITLFPIDSLRISTSLTKLTQGATMQQYDTISQIGTGFTTPYVLRAIDEETIAQTWLYTPDSRWINIKASMGTGHTQQDETVPFGWVGNTPAPAYYCIGFTAYRRSTGLPAPTQSARQCKGDRLDAYNFQNSNFDLANTAELYKNDEFDINLLTGIQFARQKTTTERNYGNPASTLALAGDPNPVASSIRTSTAFYLQPATRIQRLTITPGYRKDYVLLEAIGKNREALDEATQRHEIRVNEEIYNLALAYDLIPKNLSIFTNYGQGFRPIPVGNAFLTANGVGNALASVSACPINYASCDNVYKTQRIESTEAGMSYSGNRILDIPLRLTSKATFFHSHTSNTVLGVDQDDPYYGTQIRNGWEFESSLEYQGFYGLASYSRIAGKTIVDATKEEIPIYSLPGNALSLTLGFTITSSFDVNINYRHIGEKRIISGSTTGTNGITGTQPAYELFNAGARWSPNKHLTFRLIGENLANKQYNLDGGFTGDLGLPGPGRNIKFYTELIY